ncbi:MAG TPA: DUF6265 family protein [Terriglobia bacterium]
MSCDSALAPRCVLRSQPCLRRALGLLAAALLWLAVGSRPLQFAQAQQPGTQPPAPVVNGPLVQDLGFIAGNWRGGVAGGIFDEQWSQPSADSMIGMFRYMEAGKVKFYEFMAIEATAAGPVFRLRHFDPGLAAWEDKSAPLSLPVASFTENQVVFETTDKSTHLTYRRSSADSLTVVLERTAGGHTGKQEFNFTLIK